MRIPVIVARVVLAASSLAGIATQLAVSASTGGASGVVNLFGYFTILSNVLASVVLLVGAAQLARGVEPGPVGVAVRGASVVYMVFVGLVFAVLLRDVPLGPLQSWVNTVHHYVMPVAVLLDWVLRPPGRPVAARTAFAYALIPALYTAYSLVRGALTGFYPYPFFDPEQAGGYGGVALYCAVMLIVFVLLSLLVRRIGARRARTPAVA